LRAIATAGRGRFVNGNGADGMPQISQEIVALERTRFESQEGSIPVERFPWFLAAGLGLILIETLITERRRRSSKLQQQERSKAA
jgi:hypothetical protein